MPSTLLTPQREATLHAVRELAAQHRYAPTVREVADRLGIVAATAYGHLTALRRAGLVDWQDGSIRTLHVTERGDAALNS